MEGLFETILAINSKDRYSGTSGNYNYQFTQFGKSEAKYFRVNKVSIPYSYYNTKQQTFRVKVDADPYVLIILPAGSYTPSSLITKLLALINPSVSSPLTISYDQVTNKFTMSVGVGHTFAIDFAYDTTIPLNYNIGTQMGYNFTSVNTDTQDHVSDYIVNLNATTNLYIFSQKLSVYMNGYFQKNRSTIIQTIPIQVNSLSYIVWENIQQTIFALDSLGINSIDIQLQDDYGNTIDLNNQDWTIELQTYSKNSQN